jgi:hypothetical protein
VQVQQRQVFRMVRLQRQCHSLARWQELMLVSAQQQQAWVCLRLTHAG